MRADSRVVIVSYRGTTWTCRCVPMANDDRLWWVESVQFGGVWLPARRVLMQSVVNDLETIVRLMPSNKDAA